MASKPISDVKADFETGDYPESDEFIDLIDSVIDRSRHTGADPTADSVSVATPTGYTLQEKLDLTDTEIEAIQTSITDLNTGDIASLNQTGTLDEELDTITADYTNQISSLDSDDIPYTTDTGLSVTEKLDILTANILTVNSTQTGSIATGIRVLSQNGINWVISISDDGIIETVLASEF